MSTRAALACLALVAGCADPAEEAGDGLRTLLGEATVRGSAPASRPDETFARAERVREFSFPRDHGPHPTFRSEWWYLTGILATAEGREFGVQFTLFRQSLAPRDNPVATVGTAAWRSGQAYMGHVAVSDVAARRHWHEERLARGHPAIAGVAAEPFQAHIDGWRLASEGEAFWPLRLVGRTKHFAIDVAMSATKPVVLQGEQGLSRKGPHNASYYYSIPRIDAVGTIAIQGATYRVAGSAWLDREWSTSVLAPEYAGWDWFALRLGDGRDLMLYRMRRRDGRTDDYNSGTLIDTYGRAQVLTSRDFSLQVAERWHRWPVAWRLTLHEPTPSKWRIRAMFEDQVMATSVRYWEGAVTVEDNDGKRIGSGYMELTGY